MKPPFSIFRDGQCWGVVYRNTILVLAGESYQVASNVVDAGNRDPSNRTSECAEVAGSFILALDRYPGQRQIQFTPETCPGRPCSTGCDHVGWGRWL
jgi:hypothetical protein